MIEPLDYEVSHEYYITIEATDGGSPPLSDMATVNINLTDVNDNGPAFSQDVYTAVVSEDTELGKTVMMVRIHIPSLGSCLLTVGVCWVTTTDCHYKSVCGVKDCFHHFLLIILQSFTFSLSCSFTPSQLLLSAYYSLHTLSNICTCGKSPSGGTAKLGPMLFMLTAPLFSCII